MIIYNRQFTEENELGYKADKKECERIIGLEGEDGKLGKSGNRTHLKLIKTMVIDQIFIGEEFVNGSRNVRKVERLRSEETLEKGKIYRLDTKYHFTKETDGRPVERYRLELNAEITGAEDKILRTLYEPLPAKYRHQIKHRYFIKDTETSLIYTIDFIDEDTEGFNPDETIVEIEFENNGTKDAWKMPKWLKEIVKKETENS